MTKNSGNLLEDAYALSRFSKSEFLESGGIYILATKNVKEL